MEDKVMAGDSNKPLHRMSAGALCLDLGSCRDAAGWRPRLLGRGTIGCPFGVHR